MLGSQVFLMEPKHQFIYHNKENELVVPSQKKKGDYYLNPWLSQLKDESQFKKW